MRVVWLEMNSAYMVMFGDSVINIEGTYFFTTKNELKDYLQPLGLKVLKNKIIKMEDK